MFIYAFLLFFVLTPGVLLSLPPKGSKMVVAGVHALVFAIVWQITHKMVWKATSGLFESMSKYNNTEDRIYSLYESEDRINPLYKCINNPATC